MQDWYRGGKLIDAPVLPIVTCRICRRQIRTQDDAGTATPLWWGGAECRSCFEALEPTRIPMDRTLDQD